MAGKLKQLNPSDIGRVVGLLQSAQLEMDELWLIDKGKEKQCLQQIYDFIDDGVLAEELFETLCAELGIESR
jgi:hypothetical protein